MRVNITDCPEIDCERPLSAAAPRLPNHKKRVTNWCSSVPLYTEQPTPPLLKGEVPKGLVTCSVYAHNSGRRPTAMGFGKNVLCEKGGGVGVEWYCPYISGGIPAILFVTQISYTGFCPFLLCTNQNNIQFCPILITFFAFSLFLFISLIYVLKYYSNDIIRKFSSWIASYKNHLL